MVQSAGLAHPGIMDWFLESLVNYVLQGMFLIPCVIVKKFYLLYELLNCFCLFNMGQPIFSLMLRRVINKPGYKMTYEACPSGIFPFSCQECLLKWLGLRFTVFLHFVKRIFYLALIRRITPGLHIKVLVNAGKPMFCFGFFPFELRRGIDSSGSEPLDSSSSVSTV